MELNGKLYAISGARGVWRYDGSWTQLSKIPYPAWATWATEEEISEQIMDIVVHKGKIYVIGEKFSTNVLEYDEALDRWNPVDSVIETYDETIDPDDPFADPYRGHRTFHNTPSRRYTLASDGNHLEEKGWRLVNGNWCDDWKCIANDGTYDMIAVGDTLYLANWEGVLKFPLVDLDSAISKEKSYPTAY